MGNYDDDRLLREEIRQLTEKMEALIREVQALQERLNNNLNLA